MSEVAAEDFEVIRRQVHEFVRSAVLPRETSEIQRLIVGGGLVRQAVSGS